MEINVSMLVIALMEHFLITIHNFVRIAHHPAILVSLKLSALHAQMDTIKKMMNVWVIVGADGLASTLHVSNANHLANNVQPQ